MVPSLLMPANQDSACDGRFLEMVLQDLQIIGMFALPNLASIPRQLPIHRWMHDPGFCCLHSSLCLWTLHPESLVSNTFHKKKSIPMG
jgi:hypothetical protein